LKDSCPTTVLIGKGAIVEEDQEFERLAAGLCPSSFEEFVNGVKVPDELKNNSRPTYKAYPIKSYHVLKSLIKYDQFKLLYIEGNCAFVEPPKNWSGRKTKNHIRRLCEGAAYTSRVKRRTKKLRERYGKDWLWR